MKSKILLYLPVIHKGYLDLVKKYPNSDVFVLDNSMISMIDEEFDYLRKEIRSLDPNQALEALKAIFPDRKIGLLSLEDFKKNFVHTGLDTINKATTANSKSQLSKTKIVLPKEDIFLWLAKKYLSKTNSENKNYGNNFIVGFEPTFLRWNRNNSTQKKELESSVKVSSDKFDKKMMAAAQKQQDLSSDWWRQVGAILVKNGKIILVAHNEHLPSPYAPYISGDPRNGAHKGEDIDISTAIHAEAGLISKAAKDGVSLDGTEIYVTTFPCPTCAKLVASSGISKLYFNEGYSMIDGDSILKDSEVEILKID